MDSSIVTRNEMLPKVSVIIITYNRSQLLPVAIDSVLAQTYPSIEVIVVDDGSTDDTPEVMLHYAERVRYIRQENRGVPAARNTGIRAATGDFINFLDSDDFFLPTKIVQSPTGCRLGTLWILSGG
jgi:glycosyltransferase involved in cell wall biosynthesis